MIPAEFVQLARDYHGGSGTMLYAVASTGDLTRGTIRPPDSTDEEWEIWQNLALEIADARQHATGPDAEALGRFESFAESVADGLADRVRPEIEVTHDELERLLQNPDDSFLWLKCDDGKAWIFR